MILGASLAALFLVLRDPSPLTLPPGEVHLASLDGLKVRYETFGTGKEALVFIHGWSCDLSFWADQVGAFPGRATVAIDLPGHGGSDSPDVSYSADLFARAINAVLEAQGVSRAVLVGHSMGTPAIRQFYRLYPEKTLALVAVDGTLRGMGTPEQFRALAARYRTDNYKAAIGSAVDSMFGPTAPPDLRAAVKDVMTRTPSRVVASAMEGMGDPALWAPDPIKVPLLVVLAKSPLWAGDYEQFVRGLAPQVDYHVLDGVDHFLMLESPTRFNELLTDFLSRNGLLPPSPR
jgi:pimeloyl-ACP methyl ester carboxylesterase